MSDDEEHTFESADAGSSDTFPIRAGEVRADVGAGGLSYTTVPRFLQQQPHPPPPPPHQVKKGGFVCIKGHPCKVIEITTSKTGKHGHAKANITAVDIFTNKKCVFRVLDVFAVSLVPSATHAHPSPPSFVQVRGCRAHLAQPCVSLREAH